MSWALLLFFAGIAIGVPVAFALGFAGAMYILMSGQANLNVIPTIMFGAMDSFPLLAVPLFIMAGDLMGRCGMLDRLIDFAKALIGPVQGGLAQVTVLSSMGFSAVSGVSLADAAAVGRAMIPGMIKEGYPPGFAAAITAASCVMGAIIPPSVGMLLIAYIYGGRLSVGRLFLSGVLPGILIGLILMLTVALVAKRRKFPKSAEPWSVRDILSKFRLAFIGLGMPVIIIGGIKTGLFTPTEAGAIAVAYALAFGSIGGMHLSLRDIGDSLLLSAKMSGVIFIMLATSQVFSWLLILNQVPQQLGPWLQPVIGSPEAFLVTVMLAFIVLGTFLEGVPTMIMVIPVVAPMAPMFGVDAHHLALVMLMATQFAILSPPVALALFIVCPIAGCTTSEATAELWPYAGCILLVTIAVIFVPELVHFIPRLAGYPIP
jgi:tripartite ATP-independent transporter DctM subunit